MIQQIVTLIFLVPTLSLLPSTFKSGSNVTSKASFFASKRAIVLQQRGSDSGDVSSKAQVEGPRRFSKYHKESSGEFSKESASRGKSSRTVQVERDERSQKAAKWNTNIDPIVRAQQNLVRSIKEMALRGDWRGVLLLLDTKTCPGNVYIYNAAISALAKSARWREGISMLQRMRDDGFPPDLICYTTVINACGRARQVDEALLLLRELQSNGLKADPVAYGAVIDGAAKGGGKYSTLARELLEEMIEGGLVPTQPCWGACITALARNKDVDGAIEVLNQMRECGLEANEIVFNAAIDACAKANPPRPQLAIKLLKDMQLAGVFPTDYSFNSAISACGKAGLAEEANNLIQVMKESGLQPTELSYTAAMTKGSGKQALKVMKRGGITPDSRAYGAATASESAANARDLLGVSLKAGVQPGIEAYNAAIHAASKEDDLKEAITLLDAMRVEGLSPTLKSYSSILYACGRVGDADKAMNLLAAMETEGVQPDTMAMNHVIMACGRARRDKMGLKILKSMVLNGPAPNKHTYTVAMSAVISDLNQVMQLMKDMEKSGLEIDEVTYAVALRSCAKSSSSEAAKQALLLIKEMKNKGITPEEREIEFFISRYKTAALKEKQTRSSRGNNF